VDDWSFSEHIPALDCSSSPAARPSSASQAQAGHHTLQVSSLDKG
jgi:hypothetical protein